ncbi:putative glucokinase [Ceratocystis lukuohia]|uniref:Phosphotransferase n=1 Tax=Ceratocystis lukuohia TaxID=2019550 RepID=A0ABR4MFG7_9PEZI
MADAKESELHKRAQQIASEFDLDATQVNSAVSHLVQHLNSALSHESTTQIPSFITSLPTGTEKGVFLGVDLGGTNCRVCSVQLQGDSTYTLLQTISEIPRVVMTEHSYMPLFLFVAKCIADFLAENPHLTKPTEEQGPTPVLPLPLGFIFSFTFEQHSLARGVLLQWDKGWAIPTAIGRDPCQMLQEAVDTLKLPVSVCALANDSVGTLLARAYTNPTSPPTLMGAIFGTGTNAAYVEQQSKIHKLASRKASDLGASCGVMLMNTEWGGCFDDNTAALPSTQYDQILDRESTNPGQQTLEKHVSGLYLGELLRLALLDLVNSNLLRFEIRNSETCPLLKQYHIDSELLSVLAGDRSPDLLMSRQVVAERLQISDITPEDAKAIRTIAMAIGRRAGRTAGVAVAGIIIQSGRVSKFDAKAAPFTAESKIKAPEGLLVETKETNAIGCGSAFRLVYRLIKRFFKNKPASPPSHPTIPSSELQFKAQTTSPVSSPTLSDTKTATFSSDCGSEIDTGTIDIGVDGSLIEYYPSFEADLRSALRDVVQIGEAGEQRVKMGVAKNGSSIGAAIAALYQSEELADKSLIKSDTTTE